MGKDDRRNSRQADPSDSDGHAMSSHGNMLHMTAELVPAFSGCDKTYPVTRWIQDVEDHAEIFSWSPLQQLLVARRALTGTAALWFRAERPHKTWDELKTALSKEFTVTVDVKTIHEMMSARKKRPEESCLDYMLVMKELGKRGKMADYVAIKYIVDGIVDKEIYKTMLYGLTTYSELKEKLKIYEVISGKIKAENRSVVQRQQTQVYTQGRRQTESRKCYNCGEHNHLSIECPHKNKGVKCFNCNSFGHVASQCSSRPGGSGMIRGNAGNVSTSQHQRHFRTQAGNIGQPRPSSSGTARQTLETFCCDETERNQLSVVEGNTDEQDGGSGDQCGDDECRVDIFNVNNVGMRKVIKKPVKSVEIFGKFIEALTDSGSDVSLISSECYNSLGSPKCEKTNVIMSGLGCTEVRGLGLLKTTVTIDGQTFKDVSFYIVPKNVMPYSMIIGQNLLQHTVMVMDNNKVFFLPANEEWFRNLMCFASDFDIIGREVSPAVQERVKKMMTTYVPLKTKEAPIQLRIHLKDDIPVAQRPRRISLKEQQEVDTQIEKWLDEGIIRPKLSKKQ